MDKLQWNLNENTMICIEKVYLKMLFTFNSLRPSDAYMRQ